jgi:TonB family protein
VSKDTGNLAQLLPFLICSELRKDIPMRKAVASVSVVVITLFLSSTVAIQGQIGSQESIKEVVGDVDRLVEQLKTRDEVVISSCLENCQAKKATTELTGGVILERGKPEYPLIARMARASGSVVVLVAVDEEGNVIAAQSVSGHPLLQAAAVKAARETTFSAFMLGDRAVKVRGTLTYSFLMD